MWGIDNIGGMWYIRTMGAIPRPRGTTTMDALKRTGDAFAKAAERDEFTNLRALASTWRLIDDGVQIGPVFKFVSDAVDWRKAHAPSAMAIPVEG